MNGLNSYIPGKVQPSYNCILPSSLLLFPTESSRNEACVPFASAKFTFLSLPPTLQIVLDQQFRTPDFTQEQQMRKSVVPLPALSGTAASCRWDRWLTPEAVQSTLVKSAAQLLVPQLYSQNPRCKLFLESSVRPTRGPCLPAFSFSSPSCLLSFGFRSPHISGPYSMCPTHPLEPVISLTAQPSTKDLFRSARYTHCRNSCHTLGSFSDPPWKFSF